MQSATLTLRTLKQIGPLLAAKLAVSHISPAILIGTSFRRAETVGLASGHFLLRSVRNHA
jgi:hypothetical protein